MVFLRRSFTLILISLFSPAPAWAGVTVETGLGLGLFRSSGSALMNERLEGGLALDVPERHGRIAAYRLRVAIPDKEFKRAIDSEISFGRQSILAHGLASELSSQVSLSTLTAGMVWRLLPWGGSLAALGRGRWQDRFFLFAGPLGGFGLFSHSYGLSSSLSETRVRYDASSALLLGGVRVQAGCAVLPWFHVALGAMGQLGLPISTTTRVENFWVRGQNLLYRSDDLRVDELTSALLQDAHVTGSISVFF